MSNLEQNYMFISIVICQINLGTNYIFISVFYETFIIVKIITHYHKNKEKQQKYDTKQKHREKCNNIQNL